MPIFSVTDSTGCAKLGPTVKFPSQRSSVYPPVRQKLKRPWTLSSDWWSPDHAVPWAERAVTEVDVDEGLYGNVHDDEGPSRSEPPFHGEGVDDSGAAGICWSTRARATVK
ncbi:hypothetical protein BV898_11136 [Hypsibius exemplaris]|uniref:Uncharacterized protein n=1 Tax=Hypsibius exemplaris TaxID=2072580 RepID=A0A1W0WHF0_HYPEX|nr:hypothetical protein BV898_11136 [Hypsibius exemplaris]